MLTSLLFLMTACEQQSLEETIQATGHDQLSTAIASHSHGDACNECNLPPEYTKELMVKLPFARKATLETIEVRDGLAFYQGDIVLGKADDIINRGVSTDSNRWTNSTIPYTIAPGFSSTVINRIMDAIDHLNTNTTLCVVPRTTENDYVEFIPEGGCASWVGMVGGKQTIWLGGCSFGSTMHEILHASGIWHEQSREDRDNYITVNTANITSGREHNFFIADVNNSTDHGTYDYGSLMHYSNYAFSSNGQPTITTIPPGISIGQRTALSTGDIATLAAMYAGCSSGCDGGTTASGCGVTVSVSGLTVTLNANSNSTGIIKVRRPNWSWWDTLCNDWEGNNCTAGKSVTVPSTGTYVIHTQFGGTCTFNVDIDGNTGGGTDNDGDGVCSDVDCDDNNASVGAQQPAGTSCNDEASNTINDVILADGCTCEGTPIGGCNNPITINENCNSASVEVCGDEISITVTDSSIRHITVNDVDAGWAVVELVCASWSNTCGPGTYTYTVTQSGNYTVQFNYYNSPACGTSSFYVQQKIELVVKCHLRQNN